LHKITLDGIILSHDDRIVSIVIIVDYETVKRFYNWGFLLEEETAPDAM